MRVPVQSQLISTSVPAGPAQDISSAGMLERTVGATVAGIADMGSQITKSLIEEEAKHKSLTEKADYDMWSDKTWNELKLAYPDGKVKDKDGNDLFENGAPVTLDQQFYRIANDNYKERMQRMPSQLAQDMFEQSTVPVITGKFGVATAETQAMRANAMIIENNKKAREYADFVNKYPSTDNVYKRAADIELLMNPHVS